jgi:hypothetical protein
MGLMMSDTLLIDPMLDDSRRLLDSLGELSYLTDMARDSYEDDHADLPA